MRHELGTLHDIVDSARLAREYVKELSLEQFRRDSLHQDAVCRRLLVIGEAVRRLPGPERVGGAVRSQLAP